MSDLRWLVELQHRGENMPALYLYGDSKESIARNLIEADDYYGDPGTPERMAKCWTHNPFIANTYSEDGAKQTAKALDRCCGGVAVAVAVEHMFIGEQRSRLDE